MADPKYAGLPGIATDQPDFYETFSDRDTDPVWTFFLKICWDGGKGGFLGIHNPRRRF